MSWNVLTPDQVFGSERTAKLRESGLWRDQVLPELVDSWADESPDDVAVIDDERQLSIGELRDLAWKVAGGLHEQGVRPGDRVVVQVTNRVEAVVAMCGVVRLGAILLPAQTALRKYDIAQMLARTQPTAIISIGQHRGFDHREMLAEVVADVPSVRGVFIVGSDPGPFRAFDELLSAAPYTGPLPDPDDPMLIIFTSGTTAQPKGCVHTGNTYLSTGRGTGAALATTRDDVILMPSPVMHTTGLVVGVMVPLVYRVTTVLQAIWEPHAAMELIARHRCTLTVGATAFATMFLDAYDPARHDMSSMRIFGLAGSPIPAKTVQQVQGTFGVDVATLYGSTEALIATATRVGDPIERIASSDGIATEGVEIWIVDPFGRELPRGTEGEIRLKSPGRFLCYWADDERTREVVDEHGRFKSGDNARMDEDGYIRLVGRKSEMIIRGGMNISPAEIESLLVEHPLIADVAVVAMPDERLGEKSCAFVVSSGDHAPTLADVVSFLSDRGLAKFKLRETIAARLAEEPLATA